MAFDWLRGRVVRTSAMPTGPVPFGLKIGWIAVRSEDSGNIISSLPVRTQRPAGWQEGIEAAYKGDQVFVTPPVNGWICIAGEWAMGGEIDSPSNPLRSSWPISVRPLARRTRMLRIG
jgi:hypothetical protein